MQNATLVEPTCLKHSVIKHAETLLVWCMLNPHRCQHNNEQTTVVEHNKNLSLRIQEFNYHDSSACWNVWKKCDAYCRATLHNPTPQTRLPTLSHLHIGDASKCSSLLSQGEQCQGQRENIGVVRGGAWSPKRLAYIVILCFERRYPKPSSVIRLKLNISALPKFWTGYATTGEQLFDREWRFLGPHLS